MKKIKTLTESKKINCLSVSSLFVKTFDLYVSSHVLSVS